MASDIAIGTTSRPQASMAKWLGFLAMFSVLAAAGGTLLGLYLSSQAKTTTAKDGVEARPGTSTPNLTVRELPPIITNLQTSDIWVRVHVAIIFDPTLVPSPDILTTELTSDILGFLQTLSVAQLSGASGLQHLREDLNDRAIVRSEGRVHELVIESLVVQ